MAGRRHIGRYTVYGPIAAGGMASVFFGRLHADAGFTRVVAIKRLHPSFAADPELAASFIDEARITSRIHHPNVAGVLDVLQDEGEMFVVMEYVRGLSLDRLLADAEAAGRPLSTSCAVAIGVGMLHGLHAAHEARSAAGEPLAIVHRDVSPQNIVVGEDGVARVIDFGVAKARELVGKGPSHEVRGKVLYMAPEQLEEKAVDRRADIYSAAVVLWEMLTGRRFIEPGDNEVAALAAAIDRDPEPPSKYAKGIAHELDAVVLRGLSREPADRYASAHEMGEALELVMKPATQRELAAWVASAAATTLQERAASVAAIEHPDATR